MIMSYTRWKALRVGCGSLGQHVEVLVERALPILAAELIQILTLADQRKYFATTSHGMSSAPLARGNEAAGAEAAARGPLRLVVELNGEVPSTVPNRITARFCSDSPLSHPGERCAGIRLRLWFPRHWCRLRSGNAAKDCRGQLAEARRREREGEIAKEREERWGGSAGG